MHVSVPSGRWGHDMCLIDKRKVVLIGGQGSKQQMVKDSVWTLNMSQGTVGKLNTDNCIESRHLACIPYQCITE